MVVRHLRDDCGVVGEAEVMMMVTTSMITIRVQATKY